MHDLIETLYGYNSWAARRLLRAMKSLSAEEYATVEASGHGSIRETFAHYVAVQWAWFSWFDGSLPADEAYTLSIDSREFETVERAENQWRRVDEQTRACVGGLDDDALAEAWSWDLPGGTTNALPLWQLIIHVANHQTHTRAQIIAALRRAGHDPGVYEFLAYAVERAGNARQGE